MFFSTELNLHITYYLIPLLFNYLLITYYLMSLQKDWDLDWACQSINPCLCLQGVFL